MSYTDDLKSGEWQRKRLEILNRDGFMCIFCGKSDNVQIHHLYYRPKFKPWDYENESLITVCAVHHEILTRELPKLAGLIAIDILKEKYSVL